MVAAFDFVRPVMGAPFFATFGTHFFLLPPPRVFMLALPSARAIMPTGPFALVLPFGVRILTLPNARVCMLTLRTAFSWFGVGCFAFIC